MSGTFFVQETSGTGQQAPATEDAWWLLGDQLLWYAVALMCAAMLVAIGAVASKGVRATSRTALLADIRKISLWSSYTIVMFQSCVPGVWVTLAALERSVTVGSAKEGASVVIAAIASYFMIGLSVEKAAARTVADKKTAKKEKAAAAE